MSASAATASAALQPISMGLAGLYGSTAAGAARGLALRMDHGSQYLSDHFTNQIKFWGIQPSYAFVAEPQTNGVAERFNRTLKEQIIHGRIYRNIAELRDAVRDFVELYNAQWIVEKNGYLSPAQARQAWRNLSTTLRHRRFLFTDSFLLLWKWRVGCLLLWKWRVG